MMFLMTPRDALRIQAEQLLYYSRRYPHLAAAASAANNTDGLDLDEPLPVHEVHKRIPCGKHLGWLIGEEF